MPWPQITVKFMHHCLNRKKLRVNTQKVIFIYLLATPLYLQAQTRNMAQAKMEGNQVKAIIDIHPDEWLKYQLN